MPFRLTILLFVLLITTRTLSAEAPRLLKPGPSLDYAPLAFYPERWKEQGVSMEMFPWRGKEVVFLTTSSDLDQQVMAGLLDKLDEGWNHYAKLTGRRPRLTRQVDGLPVIAAVPSGKLTCGYGCGFVGVTGIELSAFNRKDYKNIAADPTAIPDYYFYEMGRNYFTFGDRHSCFKTGFAVFMRYVCVDRLKLKTGDSTRRAIELAESRHQQSEMPFLKTFTNVDGLSEKQPRLKDAKGRSVRLSDQPVMYASAMLRLRKEYGGDEFVERFYRQLQGCPKFNGKNKTGAVGQTISWLVAASCAAKQDLSPIFADQWRMELTPRARQTMAEINWSDEIDAGQIVPKLISP